MSDSPDAIRADIERTQRDLGENVDALADKVDPSKIMDRQADKVKNAVGSVKDRILGTDDGDNSSMTDSVSDAKDRAVAKAQGSPLAVGLIAFGVGLVVASLFPASRVERDAASTVKEQAQPLIDEATETAKEIGEHLKEPAHDAAAAVKDAATDAVENVQATGQNAAHAVSDRAQSAQANISDS
ncbi:DUF3618 domain-containing protein [Homoserinimonas sp. OAct 916]|uniref:DUF3618 domain-containing protein n=1 Tax=Homoserinimonas sp. OAct 916 TaxID=2211450 RepID=UPI000DBE0E4E|nr:DUF3618 domain-containing protein [Homoserinimonas sp. OAct 916]